MKLSRVHRKLILVLGSIVVFFFVWMYSGTQDLFLSIAITLSVVAFVGIPFIGRNRRRHKKHLAFPTGKLLKPLREKHGFEVEQLNGNKYCGLKGVYRGYFCRVYFDWNTSLHVKWASGEICVMIYYEPVIGLDKKPDVEKLNSLNKEYRHTGYFRSYIDDFLFETAHIRVHRALYWITEWYDIKERVDEAIDLLEKEKLNPISPQRADELLSEDEYLHGPMVESFVFKDVEKRK